MCKAIYHTCLLLCFRYDITSENRTCNPVPSPCAIQICYQECLEGLNLINFRIISSFQSHQSLMESNSRELYTVYIPP